MGLRGANGVIMITTKSGAGAKGKINISYKGTYSVDKIFLTHDLQKNYGSGRGGLFQSTPTGGRSWGDKIADRPGGADDFITTGAYFEANDGTLYYPIANGTATDPSGGKNSREVFDYKDILFQNGSYFENAISLSGGDKSGNFYMSFSDMNQEGIAVNNSDYRRTTGSISAEKRMSNIVNLKGNFTYSRIKSNRVQMGSNLSGLYLGGLRTPADFDSRDYEGTYYDATGFATPNRERAYRNPIGASANSIYNNPLWMMEHILDFTTVDRFIGSIQADVDATDWLTLTARVGADHYNDKRDAFFDVNSAGTNANGRYSAQSIKETQINGDFFARGSFELSQDVQLTGLVGFNVNQRIFENVFGQIRNFIITVDPPFDLTNSTPENSLTSNSFSQIRTAATYATAGFGYKDYLFLNLTGRAESSSTFGKDADPFFFYPSADIAFQFTNAIDGLKGNKVLSFGKLRIAYGEVGVQPGGAYGTPTYFNSGSYAESWGPGLAAGAYGGGFIRSNLVGNPDIRPERKKELEFGADLRFLNNRISLSATYFTNKTEDVILNIPIAPSTGGTLKLTNAAEIENKGVELELSGDVLRKSDFSWNVSANFTTYTNEVTSLSGSESIFLGGFAGTSSRAVEGQPLGTLWGTKWARNETTGDIVLDANGFPTLSPEEGVIGNPVPDFRMGIGNTFNFKGLRLYVLFDMT